MAKRKRLVNGIGIDASGGPVIDPTENVIALVKAGEVTNAIVRAADQRFLDAQLIASEKIQNFARDHDAKFQNFAREGEAKLQTALREAESRRIDQVASTRQEFLNTIRDMLAESVRSTSSLVSTQLVQIQTTFDNRVTKLEASQLTQAGRSSIADPAISASLDRLNAAINSLQASGGAGTARSMGMGQVVAWIFAGVMAVATIGTAVAAIIALSTHH